MKRLIVAAQFFSLEGPGTIKALVIGMDRLGPVTDGGSMSKKKFHGIQPRFFGTRRKNKFASGKLAIEVGIVEGNRGVGKGISGVEDIGITVEEKIPDEVDAAKPQGLEEEVHGSCPGSRQPDDENFSGWDHSFREGS